MRFRHLLAATILLGLISGSCNFALGETTMKVEMGWGWRPRADRWTPVFVTASSDRTRNVLLNIEWPQGGKFSTHIEQAMTIDAHKRMFPILVPVRGWDYQQAGFILTDRESGKTLAHFPPTGDEAVTYYGGYPDASAPFVGVSGSAAQLQSLASAVGSINIGFMQPRRLPTSPMGFDSLDVLILNGPNLVAGVSGSASLDDDQQLAIVEWVRAGGSLILWPGESGFPSSGPLADVLPAKAGVREDITLTADDLPAIGLPPSFKNLPAFHLEPSPGAGKISLLNAGQATAYKKRLGLGRVILSPINLADLQIDSSVHARKLWSPVVSEIFPLAEKGNSPSGNEGETARERNASIELADFLAGSADSPFDKTSLLLAVLLGVCVVIGPLDSLILKLLGRRPWTVLTVGGWIALLGSGIACGRLMFQARHVGYYTLQTIDQAGDATVATTDLLSLRTSKACDFQLIADADGWWQPTGYDDHVWAPLKLDVDFHQTSRGNSPETLTTEVWNTRFLRGDHLGAGPAVLSADLKLVSAGGPDSTAKVTGILKNLGDFPLKDIHIQTHRGSCLCTLSAGASAAAPAEGPGSALQIAPHASARVEGLLVADAKPAATRDAVDYRYRYDPPLKTPDESELWKVAADLNTRRGRQMAEQVATGKFAIIYAELKNPSAEVKIEQKPTDEKHRRFVRALVELHMQDER